MPHSKTETGVISSPSLYNLGVSQYHIKKYASKGITTAEELVNFLPYRYEDFSKETGLLINQDEISCFTAILKSVKDNISGNGRRYVRCMCQVEDEDGVAKWLTVLCFNYYIASSYSQYVGKKVYIAGKVTRDPYNKKNLSVVSPLYFEPDTPDARRVRGVYSKITGILDNVRDEHIKAALRDRKNTKEIIPEEIVKEQNLASSHDMYKYLHFPHNMDELQKGLDRQDFNNLLYFSLHNELSQKCALSSSPFTVESTEAISDLKKLLPFELTADQKTTVEEIIEHIKSGKRLNALIQGDVGCGKTIVALLIMLVMAENGYQSALMAPTQILAQQHYEDISQLLEPLGVKVVFLGAKMPAKEKRESLKLIKNGEAQIVIGTHSVISDKVEFNKLALTVVDEEHKFGVEQRTRINEKAAEGVHSICMSATPIPRSLAQVMYGDTVQLYNIKTMPAGRKIVKTSMAQSRTDIYNAIRRETGKGNQVYMVCPMVLVSDADSMKAVKSVEEISEEYTKALSPYGIKVETLTGKDTKAKSDRVITAFKNGEVDVLIATTVVEVGVNVPTATLMVITSAERFGLATLHQLRGRVGRSSRESFCMLDGGNVHTQKAKERMDVMCNSNDGFVIATKDLELRGAGELFGIKQWGRNDYIGLMLERPDMYKTTQKVAKKIIDEKMDCPLLQIVLNEEKTALENEPDSEKCA